MLSMYFPLKIKILNSEMTMKIRVGDQKSRFLVTNFEQRYSLIYKEFGVQFWCVVKIQPHIFEKNHSEIMGEKWGETLIKTHLCNTIILNQKLHCIDVF